MLLLKDCIGFGGAERHIQIMDDMYTACAAFLKNVGVKCSRIYFCNFGVVGPMEQYCNDRARLMAQKQFEYGLWESVDEFDLGSDQTKELQDMVRFISMGTI